MQEPDRRARQRFAVQLPIIVQNAASGGEIHGMTRDISSRGVFFYVDEWPLDVAAIECKLLLPAEFSGKKGMRALCRGNVVRVEPEAERTGIAAIFTKRLQFLPLL